MRRRREEKETKGGRKEMRKWEEEKMELLRDVWLQGHSKEGT